jgi:hypothetical protein
MSPNVITDLDPSPQSDSAILSKTNTPVIKKIFDARECFNVNFGNEHQYWIDKCTVVIAHMSWRLKQSENEYMHDIKGCRVFRVNQTAKNGRTYSKYVWFYVMHEVSNEVTP